MKDPRPDRKQCPFSAFVEILRIKQSQSQYKEKIKTLYADLQKTLKKYDEALVIRQFSETQFQVYHNLSSFIISDLIIKKLGLENKTNPFSNNILLNTDQPTNQIQDLMRREKVQFRSSTRLKSGIQVRFDYESRSIDGFVKFRTMESKIQGFRFCNQRGHQIWEHGRFQTPN